MVVIREIFQGICGFWLPYRFGHSSLTTMEWSVGEAKAKFSAVIIRAATEGAQTITRFGQPAAIVLSPTEYQSLRSSKTERMMDFAGCLPADVAVEMLEEIERSRNDKEIAAVFDT